MGMTYNIVTSHGRCIEGTKRLRDEQNVASRRIPIETLGGGVGKGLRLAWTKSLGFI